MIVRAPLIGLVCLLAAGCGPKPVEKAAAPPPAAPLALPVSLVDVMRAEVEIPAEGIWNVTGNDKLTDQEWLLADQDAVGIIAAASLMTTPTTGAKDKVWMAGADWAGWSADIQKTGIALREAAKAKDLPKLMANGDHLLDVCTACHEKYRPEIPSDGVARFPFYPARKLVAEASPKG